MKKIILIAILFLLNPTVGFSSDTLFKQVQTKLLNDKKSFKNFCLLYDEFCNFKKNKDTLLDNHYDLSYALYNKGIPFVRLINIDAVDSCFHEIYQKNKLFKQVYLKRVYKRLVQNYNNYNTNDDFYNSAGEEVTYFSAYLKDYFIMPSTK